MERAPEPLLARHPRPVTAAATRTAVSRVVVAPALQRRAHVHGRVVADEAGQIGADVEVELGVELLFGPLFHRWLLRSAPLDAAYADRIVSYAMAGMRPRG
jgi:hypothetical protein